MTFNPYVIILWLFTATGFAVALWGWRLFVKGRATRHWPAVAGVIERSAPASNRDDLLPHIEFSYTVEGKTHLCAQPFPPGLQPMPGFAEAYVKKYPAGAPVRVYHDPAHPARATLEPGAARDDWMILAIGVMVSLGGLAFIFFSG